jgi:hypothetical protein
MAKHSQLVVPVYAGQRVARTVVADLLVWGPAVLAVIPELVTASQMLTTGGVIPPELYAKIASVGAASLVVKGAITWLMAQPGVDRLLSLIGLGAVPKSAARTADVLTVRSTPQALDAISTGQDGTP